MWPILFLWLVSNIKQGFGKEIIFCPNMGRFGNQLDHYISMLHLSKTVGRDLVLSPLIDYNSGFSLIHFDAVFNISILRNVSMNICFVSKSNLGRGPPGGLHRARIGAQIRTAPNFGQPE